MVLEGSMDVDITMASGESTDPSHQYGPQGKHSPWMSIWLQATAQTTDICMTFYITWTIDINIDLGYSRPVGSDMVLGSSTDLEITMTLSGNADHWHVWPLVAAWTWASIWPQVAAQNKDIQPSMLPLASDTSMAPSCYRTQTSTQTSGFNVAWSGGPQIPKWPPGAA